MPHDDQPSRSFVTGSNPNAAASRPTGSDTQPYGTESAPVRFLYFMLEKALDFLIGLIVKHGKLGPLTDAQKRTVTIVKDSVYARLVVEG